MDNQLALLTLCGSIIALLFVASRAQKVLRFPEGNDTMKKISASIHKGAMAYLRRQYKILIGFFVIMFVILFVMAALDLLTWFVPFAFVTGGFFSGLSGFIGMQIATRANARTAAACQKSLNKGLNVAFSAGSVMGFTVVGLGLLDISIWYLLLKLVFKLSIEDITSTMLTFGMGASSMALFARVGGGIYTKAADVGADLVGKVEAGIPEDDPRNPAVIADNVGDNVGDVAGMGADLYESYVGSILSACALGVIAFNKIVEVDRVNAVIIPMVLAAVGVLASIIGSLLVKTGEDTDQSTLFCADLVCHGTPERTAWNAWLKEEEQRRGSITGIRMRDKSRGWTDYRIAVTDWSGSEHREYASDHIYMRGFVGSLYLRKPCYRCRFRGMERSSDLTLGDYWGGGRIHPDLDDDGGLSLILCHTKKGKKLLESAAEKLIYAETDPEYAVTQNQALVRSPEEPVEREEVLKALEKGDGFRRATAAWIRRNTDGKIRWRIRRMRRLYKKKIRLLKKLYVL